MVVVSAELHMVHRNMLQFSSMPKKLNVTKRIAMLRRPICASAAESPRPIRGASPVNTTTCNITFHLSSVAKRCS